MKSKYLHSPSPVPLLAVFALSFFAIGVYYEWLSCVVSIALAAFLIYCRLVSGSIYIPKTPLMAACMVIVCFFAVSPIWAVDKGMAALGTVKFLPLPLFYISLAQIEDKNKQTFFNVIPITGAAMTIMSYALSFIPILKKYFLVSGRLAGFFQYSNTYAAYLLLGLIITVFSPRNLKIQIPICIFLLFGILMSGNRTAFVLLLLCVLALIVFLKNKKLKWSLLLAFLALTVFAGLTVAVLGNRGIIDRFFTSPLSSSTFIGRILYYKDALPVIAKHPMGLGYMGYYFLQGSFKTGVYTVVNIHNEFLQLLLDIGWIPFFICMFALIHAVIKGNTLSRAIAIVLLAHCFWDFDLQYISMCFVLILALKRNNESMINISSRPAITASAAILAAISLYFGLASCSYYFNNYRLAVKIYPSYTSAYVEMIYQASSLQEMDEIADTIFKYNDSVSVAYSIKGRAAFARGDVESMIDYMRKAISLSRYRIDEYRDYRNMLTLAISSYEKAGDVNSLEYCQTYLAEIPLMLKRLEQETSSLAWKIDVKPILTLD